VRVGLREGVCVREGECGRCLWVGVGGETVCVCNGGGWGGGIHELSSCMLTFS
jgi:hypothetical protein